MENSFIPLLVLIGAVSGFVGMLISRAIRRNRRK